MSRTPKRKRKPQGHPARIARAREAMARRGRRKPPGARPGPTDGYERYYEDARAAIAAQGWHNDLVWGSMVYACQGDFHGALERAREAGESTDPVFRKSATGELGCGYERRIFMGVGVEGPNVLREQKRFIPSPAHAGRCPKCGSSMAHVRWNDDEEFEPRPVRPEEPYFRVPARARGIAFARQGYGGGELLEPRAVKRD
jgi:hypothetical protein